MITVKTSINVQDNYSYTRCEGDIEPMQLAKEVKNILYMPGFKKNMNVIADMRSCRYDNDKIISQLKQYAETIKPIVFQKGTDYKMAIVLSSQQAMIKFSPYIALVESLKMPIKIRLFPDFLEIAGWFHLDKDATMRLQQIANT